MPVGDAHHPIEADFRGPTSSRCINGPGTELDRQQVVTIAESCMSNLLT